MTHPMAAQPPHSIAEPLVFPIGTGDVKYTHSAKETIEGVAAITRALPECRTILGPARSFASFRCERDDHSDRGNCSDCGENKRAWRCEASGVHGGPSRMTGVLQLQIR